MTKREATSENIDHIERYIESIQSKLVPTAHQNRIKNNQFRTQSDFLGFNK